MEERQRSSCWIHTGSSPPEGREPHGLPPLQTIRSVPRVSLPPANEGALGSSPSVGSFPSCGRLRGLRLINKQRAVGRDPRSRPGKLEHALRRVRRAPAQRPLGRPPGLDAAPGAGHGRARSRRAARRCAGGDRRGRGGERSRRRRDRHRDARRSPSSSGSATPGGPSPPVVSWQDQRAGELCSALAERPEAAAVRAKTGLALDPTFSAPKLAWLFDARPGAPRAGRGGRAALRRRRRAGSPGTSRGGAAHVTEPSNACRSLLVDLGDAALGRRAARPLRRARGAAARDQAVRRPRRPGVGRGGRARRAARGDARRPAGGALRPGLHVAAAWPRSRWARAPSSG